MDDLMLVGGGRLRWWGSDCVLDGGCDGNTTPDSMRCDTCGSDQSTVPLYVAERPAAIRERREAAALPS